MTSTDTAASVTTSFTCDEAFLDEVRALAQRREQSVTRLIIEALQTELVADEVAHGHSNGRVYTGYWSSPTVVEKQWNVWQKPLPDHERAHRVAEVRRSFGDYSTTVGQLQLFGLPPELLAPAQKAFDAQLVRSLAERERRYYPKEDRDGTERAGD